MSEFVGFVEGHYINVVKEFSMFIATQAHNNRKALIITNWKYI